MNTTKLMALISCFALLAACGGNDAIPDPEVDNSIPGSGNSGSSMDSIADAGLGEGEYFDDGTFPDENEKTMIIYFDFDQSQLRSEYGDLLQRHANDLANNRGMRIRLEGHADERGSREYNIGLGERRSQAVRQMLMLQGADASQIATVSFGEERPAAFGSDEDSYAQNRRVEIKYIN